MSFVEQGWKPHLQLSFAVIRRSLPTLAEGFSTLQTFIKNTYLRCLGPLLVPLTPEKLEWLVHD